ncbi:MAG: hypothetical protein R2695_01200 [Acidimicrobiales bacterium]
MRVGLVTWWFNRGQATVMRTIRRALDDLGHETHVLARPTESGFDRPGYVATDGVWDQPGVTVASRSDIPVDEYLAWAARHRLEAVLVFQNLQVEALDALRRAGIVTAGTYMWEAFGPDEAGRVAPVLDRVFALNRPSAERYRDLGLEVGEALPFALPPDGSTPGAAPPRSDTRVRFLFPAGYLRARKPLGAVVEGFRRGAPADATLTIKAQVPVRSGDLTVPSAWRDLLRRHDEHSGPLTGPVVTDPRIRIVTDDLSHPQFVDLMRRHDVVVGVSRWEGLGLHLYECDLLGIPLVLNRMEPYVDFARDGGRCLLVDSKVIGRRAQGIDVHEPDIDSLAAAFSRLSTRTAVEERFGPPRSTVERWHGFVAAVGTLVADLEARRPDGAR